MLVLASLIVKTAMMPEIQANRLMRELGPLSDLPPAFPWASPALAPLRAAAEAVGRSRAAFVRANRARRIIVFDIPLLFEKGGTQNVDGIIVVSASLWARYFEHASLPLALRRIGHVAMACAVLTAAAGITRDIGAFFAIHFAWGVLLGATTPVLMALISRSAGSLGQGYVLGVAQSTAQFSSITGIALGGWLTQSFGLQYTYFYVAACYLLAVAAVLLVRKERMPAPQQQGA